MSYENIDVERKDPVQIVRLARPKVLNALNAALLGELSAALDLAEADAAIGAIVLTGGPTEKRPSFAAGADINELATLDPLNARLHARKGQGLFDRIERFPKPVIAAVNGFALGGGCELAMACHIRYASRDGLFGQPEINLGITPGYAGTQRLARLVGKGRALEILLTGDPIPADEALRIGLVNKVTEPADLLPAAEALAKKVASKAPIARRLIIELVNRGLDATFPEGQSLEADLFGLVAGSADCKEGLKAFIEKRPAKFEGR